MKISSTITFILALVVCALFSVSPKAHPGHGHGHHHHGPNGGRLLLKASPDIEFKVTGDRRVELYAVNIKNEIVPIEKQEVKVTAGPRSKPVHLTFSKDGGKLVSDVALPEGDDIPVVLEIVVKPGGTTLVEKFVLSSDHDH